MELARLWPVPRNRKRRVQSRGGATHRDGGKPPVHHGGIRQDDRSQSCTAGAIALGEKTQNKTERDPMGDTTLNERCTSLIAQRERLPQS